MKYREIGLGEAEVEAFGQNGFKLALEQRIAVASGEKAEIGSKAVPDLLIDPTIAVPSSSSKSDNFKKASSADIDAFDDASDAGGDSSDEEGTTFKGKRGKKGSGNYVNEDGGINDIDDDDDDGDDDDSSDEDDEAALQRELAKVKAERAAAAAAREMEEQAASVASAAAGNPLMAAADGGGSGTGGSSKMKRGWNDDVVFRNQTRGEPVQKKRFINDAIRSDFHRSFMKKYMQ